MVILETNLTNQSAFHSTSIGNQTHSQLEIKSIAYSEAQEYRHDRVICRVHAY